MNGRHLSVCRRTIRSNIPVKGKCATIPWRKRNSAQVMKMLKKRAKGSGFCNSIQGGPPLCHNVIIEAWQEVIRKTFRIQNWISVPNVYSMYLTYQEELFRTCCSHYPVLIKFCRKVHAHSINAQLPVKPELVLSTSGRSCEKCTKKIVAQRSRSCPPFDVVLFFCDSTRPTLNYQRLWSATF